MICSGVQIYQCPVSSNQNLTSVPSTLSYNFSCARIYLCLKMLSFLGKRVLLAASSCFYWGAGNDGLHWRSLAGHPQNDFMRELALWVIAGDAGTILILQVCCAYVSGGQLFSFQS